MEHNGGYELDTELYVLPTPVAWKDIRCVRDDQPFNPGNVNASGVILFYDSLEAFNKDFPNEEPMVVNVLDRRTVKFPEPKGAADGV